MGKKARNYGLWGAGSGGGRHTGKTIKRSGGSETPGGARSAENRQETTKRLQRIVNKLALRTSSGEDRSST